MSKDKETIKVTLTVTFQTEDHSDIGNLDCDLERDLVNTLDSFVDRGMLTIGHDELIVDYYHIEAETMESDRVSTSVKCRKCGKVRHNVDPKSFVCRYCLGIDGTITEEE
jgi:formylmethanofuran dehydrogenase subunit E